MLIYINQTHDLDTARATAAVTTQAGDSTAHSAAVCLFNL